MQSVERILGLLTNDTSVISASDTYFYWALIIPLAGFSAFLWDGIFIGATATRQMLYSMLVASASFFGVYYAFHPLLGNHALWLAFLIYLSLRGVVQTFFGKANNEKSNRIPVRLSDKLSLYLRQTIKSKRYGKV